MRPTSHLPRVVPSPEPGRDQRKEQRFCHLGQDSQSGHSSPLTAGSDPSAARSLGAKFAWSPWVGRGASQRKKRTYLVQAQVSVSSPGAVPRPLARCSALPDAACARDFRLLSRFLRETTVNPHYCSSCRSRPPIALLRPGAVVLSAGSCRGQGPNLATTTPVDARCQEGACARGRTCVRECVYACVSVQERVCVCVRADGVSSAPGALGGELRAKPEPAALLGAGRLHR
ncbi:hypothetical protein D623_10033180 [Myotis brandtii]|uniref:Uncharacterized protein n=1 Tax=Myotis brandtii TaxID=109478 RepID=S7N6M4_MYOBR|nr:hypothetical protein D623_10033180 [Myotis brandtii]